MTTSGSANSAPGSAVNSPIHYNKHPSGIECIVVAECFGFNLGNVIKYVWRAEEKGAPIEDLRKARWYLDREIARREAASSATVRSRSNAKAHLVAVKRNVKI